MRIGSNKLGGWQNPLNGPYYGTQDWPKPKEWFLTLATILFELETYKFIEEMVINLGAHQ